MIPKTIHYIWFGGGPLTPLAEKCIESWKRFCPDYEIVRWDESNFDIDANRYCQEACEAKKWAFASDYARLWVLVHEGGIYMDTDVEVLQGLDNFLHDRAFSGFEAVDRVPTGLMAAEKDHAFFRELLRDYDDRAFRLSDGSFDTRTNVEAITEACLKHGLVLNGQKQTIEGFTLYPSEFFCPKDSRTLELHLTENSVAIHHFDGSWLSAATQEVRKIKERLKARHPRLPQIALGPLANAKYVAKTGDVAHIGRLLRSKTHRYYHG